MATRPFVAWTAVASCWKTVHKDLNCFQCDLSLSVTPNRAMLMFWSCEPPVHGMDAQSAIGTPRHWASWMSSKTCWTCLGCVASNSSVSRATAALCGAAVPRTEFGLQQYSIKRYCLPRKSLTLGQLEQLGSPPQSSGSSPPRCSCAAQLRAHGT